MVHVVMRVVALFDAPAGERMPQVMKPRPSAFGASEVQRVAELAEYASNRGITQRLAAIRHEEEIALDLRRELLAGLT